MSLKKNIIAFFVIGFLGTIGHFLYEWTNDNKIVGYFFSTNESTWEHLKLLFFPTVFYSVFEFFSAKEKPQNYIAAVVISVICGMLTIVTLFYTVSGILGYNVDFINIAIYYIGIFAMLIKKTKLLKTQKFSGNLAHWVFSGLGIIIAIAFIFWSYNPPSLGIFTPPITN